MQMLKVFEVPQRHLSTFIPLSTKDKKKDAHFIAGEFEV